MSVCVKLKPNHILKHKTGKKGPTCWPEMEWISGAFADYWPAQLGPLPSVNKLKGHQSQAHRLDKSYSPILRARMRAGRSRQAISSDHINSHPLSPNVETMSTHTMRK